MRKSIILFIESCSIEMFSVFSLSPCTVNLLIADSFIFTNIKIKIYWFFSRTTLKCWNIHSWLTFWWRIARPILKRKINILNLLIVSIRMRTWPLSMSHCHFIYNISSKVYAVKPAISKQMKYKSQQWVKLW